MRDVAVWFCPLIRNHNPNICWCRGNAGEIKLADYLGNFLELPGQRLVLPIPGCHAPAGLLGSTQVRDLVKLLRGCVGIAPKIHADAARANARIYLRTIIGGEIGRASCRERVEEWVVGGALQKNMG